MKFYGEVDKDIYDLFYADKSKEELKGGTIIEAGAADGLRFSNSMFFEETLGWQSILVEPHPELFPELIKNRPDSICLNYALSTQEGVMKLNLERDPLHSHFGQIKQNSGRNTIESQVKVHTIPYDEIFTYAQNVFHVDVMVLDVEGHEENVIMGMEGTDMWPDVMCIEMFHLKKRVENPNICGILKKNGYRFVKSTTSSGKRQLKHWDGIFSRL